MTPEESHDLGFSQPSIGFVECYAADKRSLTLAQSPARLEHFPAGANGLHIDDFRTHNFTSEMTEWEKQNMSKMSDEELAAEIPKWKPDSSRGAFARAEMERRRHAAVTSSIRAAAKPHKIFKWTLFFTVIGAVAAVIAAIDAILRWLHP